MKNIVLILLGLFTIIVAFSSCRDRYIEAASYGEYYVTNNTTSKIYLEAISNFGNTDVPLIANEISSGAKTHIYSFVEGSGGHVLPSNAWGNFYVYDSIISDSTLIYSGVHNDDWKSEGSNSEGHLLYNLTIE